MTPFDPARDAQLDALLDQADVEQLGLALARRVERLALAVDDAARAAETDGDLLVVAGAVAAAHWAARLAQSCAEAVAAVIGSADNVVTARCRLQAQRARRHADRVERRWTAMKAARGAAHA